MTLRTQMAADMQSVFFNTDEFAESVTYTTSGGSSSTISAVFDFGTDLGSYDGGAAALGTVRISKADVSAPSIYDTITRDGTTWTVKEILAGDNYEWVLSLESDQRQTPRGA